MGICDRLLAGDLLMLPNYYLIRDGVRVTIFDLTKSHFVIDSITFCHDMKSNNTTLSSYYTNDNENPSSMVSFFLFSS